MTTTNAPITAPPPEVAAAIVGPAPQADPASLRDPSPAATQSRVRTVGIGIADLAVDVIVSMVSLGVLTLIIVGGGFTAWIAGLGLLLWATIPWVLRGLHAVELRRQNAVYDLNLASLPRRHSTRSGFAKFIHQWWLDASDPTPWRAAAHLVLSSALAVALGGLALLAIPTGIAAIALPLSGHEVPGFGPFWWVIAPVALAIGCTALLVHGPIDRRCAMLLGASGRELTRRELAVAKQQARGAVAAAAQQRDSLERELHDDIQPRLVSVALHLGMAKSRFDSDPEGARDLLATAHRETKDAIATLRQLASGINSAVLSDRGLDAALSAVVARSPIPATLDVSVPPGSGAEAEAVIYFAVSEAVTNALKHARATRIAVHVLRVDDRLVATITDDGVGGARFSSGADANVSLGGLSGIRDRAVAAGGTVRLSSPPAGPTAITVEVPCES